MDNKYFTDRFRVTVPQMEQLTAAALSRGGDYSDLYFEHTVYKDLLLKDGEVSSGGFHIDSGVGIRVLKGDKTGYAYSEKTEMPDTAAASALPPTAYMFLPNVVLFQIIQAIMAAMTAGTISFGKVIS